MKNVPLEIQIALLNIACQTTLQPIKPNQLIAVCDWGRNSGEVLGYGWFVWDEQDRGFGFRVDKDINIILGTPTFDGLEDVYDTFTKATYKSLNYEQKHLLEEDYIHILNSLELTT